MRIAVLIKQVPETGSVRMDRETGTVVRDGVEAIVNPLDLYAVETALTVRERVGAGDVVALTMGPPSAAEALREVLSMGVDQGVLVSDPAFAGSDTWATSRILSRALEKLGGFDLIVCGERATDGDTGQVGPGVAAFLRLPLVAYANRFHGVSASNGTIGLSRLLDTGEERVEAPLPALLTVVKEIASPRLPTLRGKRRARSAEIAVLSNENLELPSDEVGLKGSPTRVAKVFSPKVARDCEMAEADSPEGMERAVERLLKRFGSLLGTAGKTPREDGPATLPTERIPAAPSRAPSEGGAVFVWAETDNGRLSDVAFELLARARPLADALGTNLKALLMDAETADSEVERLGAFGADEALVVESPEFESFDVEPRAACLAEIARREHPEIFLVAATYAGRSVAPYAAAELRAGLTADCVELDIDPETGEFLQTRPAIGGNIMATIKTPNAKPRMATIRPNSTNLPPPDHARKPRILRIPHSDLPIGATTKTRRLSFEPAGGCSLKDADVVLALGRGIGRAANVAAFADFADSIGAALGASREAVDRGWIPYKHQIGLSGKTVSPRLYMAFGISGAIQHLAGIRSSEVVVAVNTDPHAPIFQVADFGIVGDALEALSVLNVFLKEKHRG